MGDETELRQLEVSALQEQLKAKKLSTVGDKDQLVFRLQQSQVKGVAEPKAAPPAKDGKSRKGKGKGGKGDKGGKDGKGKGAKGWPIDSWMAAKGKGKGAFGGKGKAGGKAVMKGMMEKGMAMPKMKALMQKHKEVLMKATPKAHSKAAGKALMAGAGAPNSKAPAMLGASAKASPLGATARRFMVNRIYSKASAVARSSDVQMFAGKAFPAAPWRRNPQPVPKKAAKKDEEEEDYDPFAEEPAPHVAMEKVFRKAARKAALASGENVEWRPKGTKVTPPWKKKALAANGAVATKKVGSSMPKTAWGWLKRPGGGGGARMNRGAALAEEYFQKTDGPEAKKQKTESSRGFVQELLDKAPKELQTCRSLLVFLDKKLEAAVPDKPAVAGPEALKARLEAHAEGVGRLAGLRTPGGWDARAKRVLDITTAAASAAGEAALKALEELLAKESKELEAKLKETGDSLEAVTKEREAWAKDTLRQNWLAWCAKLLRAKETKLLADVEGDKALDDENLMTAVDVLEAVLAGTTA